MSGAVNMNNVSGLLESDGRDYKRETEIMVAITSVRHEVSTTNLPGGFVELLDTNWKNNAPLSQGIIGRFGSDALKARAFPKFIDFSPEMRGDIKEGSGQTKSTVRQAERTTHAFMTELPKSSIDVLTNVAYLKLMLKLECHSYDQKRVAVCPYNRARAESRRSDQYCCEDEDMWAIDVLLFDYLGYDVVTEFEKCLKMSNVHPHINSIPKLLNAATQYCILTCFQDNKGLAVELLKRAGCNFGVRLALKFLVAIEMGPDYDKSIVQQMQLQQQARILVGRQRNSLALIPSAEADHPGGGEDDLEDDEDDEDEELTKQCGDDFISNAEKEFNMKFGTIDKLEAGDVVSGGRFTAYNGMKKHSFEFGPHIIESLGKGLTRSAITYSPTTGAVAETFHSDKATNSGKYPLDEIRAGMEALLEKEFSHLYPTARSRQSQANDFLNKNRAGDKGMLFARACPWKIEFFDDKGRPDEKLKGVTIFMK